MLTQITLPRGEYRLDFPYACREAQLKPFEDTAKTIWSVRRRDDFRFEISLGDNIQKPDV